jgi:hypothetical protein
VNCVLVLVLILYLVCGAWAAYWVWSQWWGAEHERW